MFYVYELRDETGRPFYVGKGCKRRMHEHERRARRGIKSHLCHKIRKLWRDGHEVTKAVVFRSRDEAAAFAEERRLIAYYGRVSLVNQTDGGDGPSNPSPEVRERMAAHMRGKIPSEATRNRMRLAKLGTKRSDETKAKIAATQRTIKKPWAREIALRNLANFPPSRGRTWTDEQRRKFHAARVGHKVSQETRDKISATKKAKNEQLRTLQRNLPGNVLP